MGNTGSRTRGRYLFKKNSYLTAFKLALATFAVTMAITLPAQQAARRLNPIVSLAVIVLIILIGIAFDILGVAVAVADQAPFHAMSAKKTHGAKQALKMIRNADSVASFSNDLMGDIAGTVSGAASASLVFQIASLNPAVNQTISGIIAVGLAAALTVGGKAIGKRFAITQATSIVLRAGRILSWIEGLGGGPCQNNDKRKPGYKGR